jgi:hypothetical protein
MRQGKHQQVFQDNALIPTRSRPAILKVIARVYLFSIHPFDNYVTTTLLST